MRSGVWKPTKDSLLGQCKLERVDVEPSSHLHLLTEQVTKAASEAFSPARATPRQPWMSSTTYAVVEEMKSVSKTLRRTGRWVATASQRFVFMFWAAYTGHRRSHLCNCTVVRGFATCHLAEGEIDTGALELGGEV